jgi:NAD-dependent dihydropyrimidine dehydrogenase PreA subunit
MRRYFGVKCSSCEENIPLAVHEIAKGNKINTHLVPLEPIYCRKCGSSLRYTRADSIEFNGPDGLLAPLPPRR